MVLIERVLDVKLPLVKNAHVFGSDHGGGPVIYLKLGVDGVKMGFYRGYADVVVLRNFLVRHVALEVF